MKLNCLRFSIIWAVVKVLLYNILINQRCLLKSLELLKIIIIEEYITEKVISKIKFMRLDRSKTIQERIKKNKKQMGYQRTNEMRELSN